MTKLPKKALLNGSQVPKTTTGEMKAALGDVRDYLAELLGEDGTDKETARATLGVTAELAHKADAQTIEALRDAVEKGKDTGGYGSVFCCGYAACRLSGGGRRGCGTGDLSRSFRDNRNDFWGRGWRDDV